MLAGLGYFKILVYSAMTKRKRERRDREIELVAVKPIRETDWVVVDASLCSVSLPHYESFSSSLSETGA